MKVSVPADAPAVPPDTGASIIDSPRACAAAATLRALAGAMVLQSMTRVPAGSVASSPGFAAEPSPR